MWTELSLDVTHEAIDWVKTLLATIDPQAQLRVSPCVEPDVAWAFTVRFYLPQSVRTQEIAALLSPLHRTGLTSELQIATVEAVAEDNQLPLHRISDRFVVLSPNASYQAAADEIVLKIGTGLAFGSGLHPATIVSLRLLERHVTPNLQALDLGSGSGILSVAIAKLGGQVLALDNDTVAVEATQATVQQNQVESLVTVRQGSLGQGSEMGHWMGGSIDPTPPFSPIATFDLIAANVLARIHIALAADYYRSLRSTGLLITAGFTTDYADEMETALATAGFVQVDREQSNEWIALAHRLA